MRSARLKLAPFASEGGHDVFHIATPSLGDAPGLYLSAGIHGDEPAATEALLRWFELNAATLAEIPLLIFPCLNPWGLRNNTRTDSRGRDVNRLFHHNRHPVASGVRRITAPFRFRVAAAMHEDYDARGIYLYEVQRGRTAFGEKMLARAERVLPRDPRRRIDHSIAKNGLIRRRIIPEFFADFGYPEAIWLHLFHSENTFTFETPSEWDPAARIAAQMAVLDCCLRLFRDGKL